MRAQINSKASPERNQQRCIRLVESIGKAKARGNKTREKSLQAELDRRLAGIDELYAFKKSLE